MRTIGYETRSKRGRPTGSKNNGEAVIVRSGRRRQIKPSAKVLRIQEELRKQESIKKEKEHRAVLKSRKDAWLRYVADNHNLCKLLYVPRVQMLMG